MTKSGIGVYLSLNRLKTFADFTANMTDPDGIISENERELLLTHFETSPILAINNESYTYEEALAALCIFENEFFGNRVDQLTEDNFKLFEDGVPGQVCPGFSEDHDIAHRLRVWKDLKGNHLGLSSPNVAWPKHKRFFAQIKNGDTIEDRHKSNAGRFASTLIFLGVPPENIIMNSEEGLFPIPSGTEVFAPTLEEMERADVFLARNLQEGDLLFSYNTGHGSRAGEESELALPGGKTIKLKEMANHLKKLGSLSLIHLSDQCFSAAMPKLLSENSADQANVIAMAPNADLTFTSCQAFTPYFLDALERGVDLNGNGTTELFEPFAFGLQQYNAKIGGARVYGVYRESMSPLTQGVIDHLAKTKEPMVIEISAPWCAPCKDLEAELDKIRVHLGRNVQFYKIYDGSEGEGEQLVRKLQSLESRISNPIGFPTLIYVREGQVQGVVSDATLTIDRLREDFKLYLGIEEDPQVLRESVARHLEVSNGVPSAFALNMMDQGIEDVDFVVALYHVQYTDNPQNYIDSLKALTYKRAGEGLAASGYLKDIAVRKRNRPEEEAARLEFYGHLIKNEKELPLLMEALNHPNPKVVAGAVRGLRYVNFSIRPAEIDETLRKILNISQSDLVQAACIEVLALRSLYNRQLSGADHRKAIEQMLITFEKTRSLQVKIAVAKALKSFHNSGVHSHDVARLCRGLDRKHPSVQEAILDAFDNFMASSTVFAPSEPSYAKDMKEISEAIIHVATARRGSNQKRALKVFTRFNYYYDKYGFKQDRRPFVKWFQHGAASNEEELVLAAAALWPRSPEELALIETYLKEDQPIAVREAVLRDPMEWAEYADKKRLLKPFINHPERALRSAVIGSIQRGHHVEGLSYPEFIEPLKTIADSETDETLRATAVRALSVIELEDKESFLRKKLHDSSGTVVDAAYIGLKNISEEILWKALEEEIPKVKDGKNVGELFSLIVRSLYFEKDEGKKEKKRARVVEFLGKVIDRAQNPEVRHAAIEIFTSNLLAQAKEEEVARIVDAASKYKDDEKDRVAHFQLQIALLRRQVREQKEGTGENFTEANLKKLFKEGLESSSAKMRDAAMTVLLPTGHDEVSGLSSAVITYLERSSDWGSENGRKAIEYLSYYDDKEGQRIVWERLVRIYSRAIEGDIYTVNALKGLYAINPRLAQEKAQGLINAGKAKIALRFMAVAQCWDPQLASQLNHLAESQNANVLIDLMGVWGHADPTKLVENADRLSLFPNTYVRVHLLRNLRAVRNSDSEGKYRAAIETIFINLAHDPSPVVAQEVSES